MQDVRTGHTRDRAGKAGREMLENVSRAFGQWRQVNDEEYSTEVSPIGH